MNILDTTDRIAACFDADGFNIEKWKTYIDAFVPGAKDLCIADMQECVQAGFSWENDFLPVLSAVFEKPDQRSEAIRSFHTVTEHLDQRIRERFGKTVDADVILYLGLCNGAGWVTTIGGRITILLGIEKIMELNWHGADAFNALILHELGHVYQAQYGILHREFAALPDKFLWQLFTEGVAMVFEQEILKDSTHFHQYDTAWKQWCDTHFDLIRRSFAQDRMTMTEENQRYFGDWVSFEGHGDTGYYLGARFVRFLLDSDSFDNLISYDAEQVSSGFERFLRQCDLRIVRYTEDRIPDVLSFEKRLRDEENAWGWEIDEEYVQSVSSSFHNERFQNAISLLAYTDGQIVGRIDAVLIPSHFDGSVKAYLDWICVLKSCRHRGVAQALLSELKRQLKEQNVDTLIALTASNDEAQRFYKSVPDSIMRDIGIWIDIK